MTLNELLDESNFLQETCRRAKRQPTSVLLRDIATNLYKQLCDLQALKAYLSLFQKLTKAHYANLATTTIHPPDSLDSFVVGSARGLQQPFAEGVSFDETAASLAHCASFGRKGFLAQMETIRDNTALEKKEQFDQMHALHQRKDAFNQMVQLLTTLQKPVYIGNWNILPNLKSL